MLDRPLIILGIIPDLFITVGLIGAFIFAIARRARLGAAASTLAAIGLGILTLQQMLGAMWSLGGVRLMVREFRGQDVMAMISMYSIATRMLWAVGVGLIIGAIFVRRPAPQTPQSPFES